MRDSRIVALRRAVETVGREFEAMPYERLLERAEVLSFTRIVDGLEMTFSAEAFDVDRNGDIHFCIDADATLLGRWGWFPSYQFSKRRDGSVYHR